jgi:hypothetical protein
MLRCFIGFVILGVLASCVNEEVDYRDGCLVCHMPRPLEGGEPIGIENAHPFGDVNLDCVDCHGGDPKSYDQKTAHVDSRGAPKFIRNLTTGQLDGVDPSYLQFINPGDLRVANKGCGGASSAAGGSGCHQEIIDKVRRSMMGHTAGEVVVARFRAGVQKDIHARVGVKSIADPNYDERILGTTPSMTQFDPPPPRVDLLESIASTAAASSTLAHQLYAEIQDDYMAKSCFRCHLWDFGENRFRADYRSSGCSACHMLYSDDGISESKDPNIPKEVSPHPIKHQLTSAIPTEQCTHCHYRGGRIGPSFQGYREAGQAGTNPDHPTTLEASQHGHDGAFYIVDEDNRNQFDETPPDIHFEKGMHCIDCHFSNEVHGDGHLYGDTQVFVQIECEDCHGSIETESNLRLADGTVIKSLNRDSKNDVWLTGKVDGVKHRVTQVKRSVDPSDPAFSQPAFISMGRNTQNGFSHTDSLECYACHSAWYPSCYGCHVTVDYSKSSRVLTSGEVRVGKPSGVRGPVAIDDLVLMINTDGKIAPSMPSERFSLSVKDAQGELSFKNRVRRKTATSTKASFGQRTFQPHTVRLRSPFSSCNRCHVLQSDDAAAMEANRKRVRQTVGYGSDKYLWTDEANKTYRLDAVVDEEGNSKVEIGHPEPEESRPLSKRLRDKLLTPIQVKPNE